MPYHGPGSPPNVEAWASGITLLSELSKPLGQFAGKDNSNMIVVEDREGVGKGDKVTCTFSTMDTDGAPKTDGQAIIGQELDTTEYEHEIRLDYFKQATALENVMVEPEMVPWSTRGPKIYYLGEYWAKWYERSRIYHAVGHATTAINAATRYSLSGGNAVVAYNSGNIYYVQGGGATNTTDAEVAADTDAVMTTDVIDDLVTKATDPNDITYPIVPCSTPLGDLYVLSVGSQGFKQIRASNTNSEFRDLVHSMLGGGADYMESPLANGNGYIYHNTLVLKNPWMPKGLTAGAEQANSRAAVFGGARLLTQLWGSWAASGDHIHYEEHKVLERLTMQASTLTGINRTIVNGVTWGGIRVVHYSSI